MTLPEGALVTLKREGAEKGSMTVAHDGVTGWANANLLSEETREF